MYKIALIGDDAITHYTVADRLWELIAVITDTRIRLKIFPLSTPEDADAVFRAIRKDQDFRGCMVAPLPWPDVLTPCIDVFEDGSSAAAINTIYKDDNDQLLVAANTYPLAVQLAAESAANVYKIKRVLVLGSRGSGTAVASHFHSMLDKQTYLYDPTFDGEIQGVTLYATLAGVASQTYDLIINTTPLGRYYFDQHVEAFTSPLDLQTMQRITTPQTIVQETNYMPATTLLLQMARFLHLQVITGDLVLVYEAVEALRRCFGTTLDATTVGMLVTEIAEYITERETAILGTEEPY